MLKESFAQIYTKFKLHFYRLGFSICLQDLEATLSTGETFCMEIMFGRVNATINEFASFIEISSPNAAYKVNSLIQKGYLKKVRSENDRREYHLYPTQKYLDYYNISYSYLDTVMDRIPERFSPEEIAQLSRMLDTICDELMPEIPLRRAHLPENFAADCQEAENGQPESSD